MKRLFIALSLVAMATAAGAQPAGHVLRTGVTTICLDVDGSTIPPVCRGSGSRTDLREDICLCSNGGVSVDASVCAPGEREPGASVAYNRARRAAAQDGSLVGDVYDGAPMCVDRRTGR